MPETYIFPKQVKGDTFKGLTVTITKNSAPVDLTGAAIAIQFKTGSKVGYVSKSLSVGNGITITDAANGVFKIEPFQTNMGVGRNFYDTQITIGGVVTTYFGGYMEILQDVTNG